MTKPSFEKIAIALQADAYGKYDVDFAFINNDEIDHVEFVTVNRPLAIALREMRTAVDKLSQKLSRGEFVLTKPEISSVKVDDK